MHSASSVGVGLEMEGRHRAHVLFSGTRLIRIDATAHDGEVRRNRLLILRAGSSSLDNRLGQRPSSLYPLSSFFKRHATNLSLKTPHWPTALFLCPHFRLRQGSTPAGLPCPLPPRPKAQAIKGKNATSAVEDGEGPLLVAYVLRTGYHSSQVHITYSHALPQVAVYPRYPKSTTYSR